MRSIIHSNRNTPTPQQRKRKSAFALVIALSLMAFVLLLLLSISTLVQVETSSAQISQGRVEAEQNALLGLKMALGELQAAMGPDQRVSATADILTANPATGRKNTVGVWSSADVSSLNLDKGEFIGWLSSDAKDPSTGLPDPNFNQQGMAAPDSDHVKLVWTGSIEGNNGTPTNINDAVVVDLRLNPIETNGYTTGNFAWWIGDEGVKARVNTLSDEGGSSDEQNALLEANSFSTANPSGLPNLSAIDFQTDAERLLNWDSVAFLPSVNGNQAIKKEYFHHLTFHSSGVLADVKNGGLKKDLSLAFEMPDGAFNTSEFGSNGSRTINAPGFGLVQPIFYVVNDTGTDAHGPVWHLLRDYYRLYRIIENPLTDPTLTARVFSPNSNHAENATPNDISGSNSGLDQQPAILFAGGKAKFQNQGQYNDSRIMNPDIGQRNSHPNDDFVGLDMSMLSSDPIRMGTAGDPLRGGGQGDNSTTMPVMVTGNYMPYLLRYVMEVGIWLERRSTFNGVAVNPMVINQANRERFILHNPFNVRLLHEEIAIDSFGFETTFRVNDDQNQPVLMVTGQSSGNKENQNKQQESQRRAIIPRNVAAGFGPGEIKTVGAKSYGGSGSSQLSDPSDQVLWHSVKFGPGSTTGFVGAVQAPEDPSVPPVVDAGPEFYTLFTYANVLNNSASYGRTRWRDHRYSLMELLVATSLKQSGNSAFDQDAIRDKWPMASVIDTGMLFPGHENWFNDTAFSSGNTPAGLGRFFSGIKDANQIFIDETLLNEYAAGSNADKMQRAKPVATYDLQLKPSEYYSNERYPAFSRSNPLAPVRDSKNLLPPDDFMENSVGFPALSPDLDLAFDAIGSGSSLNPNLESWGPVDGSLLGGTAGVANPVLIELPTSPVLSLGKLQHANLSIHAHMPLHAVGNSLASVYIDPASTFNVFENRHFQQRVFYDLSYHMNEALWDSYFFSSYSIPFDGVGYNGNAVSQSFDSAFGDPNNPGSLPNSRMSLVLGPEETVAIVKGKLFDGSGVPVAEANPSVSKDAGYQRAAENLMVDGSFNVNSTSVEAWTAVLSGARDNAILLSGGTLQGVSGGSTPMARVSQPLAGEEDGSSESSDEAWSGFRSISDAEIASLATAIVAELRNRVNSNARPYLSLADFVNRETNGNGFDRTGLIQAAIDRSLLNQNYTAGGSDIDAASLNDGNVGAFPFPDNILLADGSNATGYASAPTYLMQADVLQAIGSFISVRSDTFRIRSYGQTIDPITEEITAKVWLEAIVQRVPEPANPDPNFDTDDPEYWSGLIGNQPDPNGRRFIILSVRELSEDEV